MIQALAGSALAILLSSAAYGQTTAHSPSFDVADVKATKSTDEQSSDSLPGRTNPGPQLHPEISRRRSLQCAGQHGSRRAELDQFQSLRHCRKSRPRTSPATLQLMLQTLLAERFKLAIHRQAKVTPVYALVVGKSGAKLQPAVGSGQANSCSSRTVNGQIRRTCHNITMQDLATRLPKFGGQTDMEPAGNKHGRD